MAVHMELEQTIEQYHRGLDEFSRGDPEPIKALYSHEDDNTLANSFGRAVRSWQKVSEVLDLSSSRMSDGEVSSCERVAEYLSDDLATILEVEHWRSRVGDAEEVSSFDLRVTTTFRREGTTWRMVHRHADSIATDDPSGPLRASLG